ncbi:MAG TPA: DNA methyltransferase [Verrucomicrobiae bacterium]|nr:DNA methyltransferase [Verrucomicrobiae bacterium]
MIKSEVDEKQAPPARRLIESDAFPFEFVSELAEMESWRKEVYRPIYHIHKWWAKRLGSVFRAVLLGCVLPERERLSDAFYRLHNFSGVSVFDPFMGSGTTIGEAHKLGLTALGRDINPVACESVRVALGRMDRDALVAAFGQLSGGVGERIRRLYRTTDAAGHECDALYFFWVKTLPCPACSCAVDLFSSYIFARNAYQDRKPGVQVYCPACAGVFRGNVNDAQASCPHCGQRFDPHTGPAHGAAATCPTCRQSFPIAKTIRAAGHPPSHRLFAKLVLTSSQDKLYLPIGEEDRAAYDRASQELARAGVLLPNLKLEKGYNTKQAINYGYSAWREFFNERQLLALGWLHEAVAGLADEAVRAALLNVFSGVLEFNNMFASYKGEGTGAVRHMFAHHILKPERVPIEGNVWGTSKSSGSFSTLFKSRLLRAIEYRMAPFEIAGASNGTSEGRRVFRASNAFSGRIETEWPPYALYPRAIYLSCGSSAATGLLDGSVDLVVTDPPFFDNVHYSELADFFFAWQCLGPSQFGAQRPSTRHAEEVQDARADDFATKLRAVFRECHRVLRNDGLLVFTYHHSRAEGWMSLAEAVLGAGFAVVNAHPLKAEMSVATPKSQAKEPIQLDVVLVCRKRATDARGKAEDRAALRRATDRAAAKARRLNGCGLKLSVNDRRIILISEFLVAACAGRSVGELSDLLSANLSELDVAACAPLEEDAGAKEKGTKRPEIQLALFEKPIAGDAPARRPRRQRAERPSLAKSIPEPARGRK